MRYDEQTKEDRRIFERKSFNSPVTLLDLSTIKEAQVVVHDLSVKGLGITNKKLLNPGDDLELWLRFPGEEDAVFTRGTVVWTRLQESGEYRTGIFLEKAEFAEWLKLS